MFRWAGPALRKLLSSTNLANAGKSAQRDIVGSALKRYDLRAARAERIHPQSDRILRVRTSDALYLLRLYFPPVPPSESTTPSDAREATGSAFRSATVLASQLHWLMALRSNPDILVPEPVPTRDGKPVAELGAVSSSHRCNAVLMRWLPGETKRTESWTPNDCKMAGRLLATLHAQAEGYVPPADSVLPRWDWDWAFGDWALLWALGPKFFSHDQMHVFEDAARRVDATLRDLGEDRCRFGVIHRDFKLGNLVTSEDRMGVVDFDMCGIGHHVYDLSVFRTSLAAIPTARRIALWGAFLRGYEQVRPLPAPPGGDIDRSIEAYDVLHRIAGVNSRLLRLETEAVSEATRETLVAFIKTTLNWLRTKAQHLSGAAVFGLDHGTWFVAAHNL